jgi:phosphonate C-P lyase system protein PhnK
MPTRAHHLLLVSNMTPLLEVKELKKHFQRSSGFLRRAGEVRKAVDGVSFSLSEGEVLGIVGESGSGKSTLARAVIRLIEPTDGQVLFRGEDVRALSPAGLRRWRPKAQMVFQDPLASLNPRKTVGENIGEAALVHRVVATREEMRRQSAQSLERVGLTPSTIDSYPHQFSGGQQQRICIARALALKPELLICDEAVSALDVSIQAQILHLLMELKSEMKLSLIFISHDLRVVRYLSNRVLVMHQGKVVEEAPTEQLFSNPQHPYTRLLLSSSPAEMPRKGRRN